MSVRPFIPSTPQERLGQLLMVLEQIQQAMIEQHARTVALNDCLEAQCERVKRIVTLAESVEGER